MVFKIIKDSLVLFLLVYALFDIIQHLVRYLTRCFLKDAEANCFHLVDLTNQSTIQMECNLRLAATKYKEPIILLIKETDKEQWTVLKKLCNDFENLYPVSHAEYIKYLSSETSPVVFSKNESEVTLTPDK